MNSFSLQALNQPLQDKVLPERFDVIIFDRDVQMLSSENLAQIKGAWEVARGRLIELGYQVEEYRDESSRSSRAACIREL